MTKKGAENLAFSCTCGNLHGFITRSGVKSGTHVVCFCGDCRAAQVYFGQPDPAPGPVDIFQMSPEEIQIEAGVEYLAAMRLSPNGMLRWYAKCCNAPLATTTRTPKFPFAGFDVARLTNAEALGPITTRGFVPGAGGKQSHQKPWSAVAGMARRVAKSRLTGTWKQTPFFTPGTGIPVSEPVILTKQQRAALYD